MTREESVHLAGVLATVAVLMAGAAWLQHVRERAYPLQAFDEESLYVTSGTALGHLTLAYQAVAADLYWIRAIQYYGGTKRTLAADVSSGLSGAEPAGHLLQRRYELLYPLLDLTTSLDPRFTIAYRFGAIFLAESYPAGPGRADLAVALLQKGLRERPDKWEYMQDIGFVYYWWVHSYPEAAAWFQTASEVPAAPWWRRSLAATTLARGGDRRSSRLMWQTIRDSAEIDWLRRDAERRLTQLQALDQIDALQRVVGRWAERGNAPPSDWLPLVRARLLPGVPVDPTGVAYEIGADGRVRLSQSSPLFPLPEEPASLSPRPVS